MHGSTGYDQISYSCQPVKGFNPSAHYDTKPCDLSNTPGDQCSLGIITIAKSVCNTGSQSHNIFKCCTKLYAKHI